MAFFEYVSFVVLVFFLSKVEARDFLNFSQYNVISASFYPQIKLQTYEWRYIRVELPDGFSVLSINITMKSGSTGKNKLDKSPLLCIRSGALPLPERTENMDLFSNSTLKHADNITDMGQCGRLQKNATLNVANDEVTSDSIYLGIFNRIGPARTQSKMITRGATYSFSVEVTVLGCQNPFLRGSSCNTSISYVACNNYSAELSKRQLFGDSVEEMETYKQKSLTTGKDDRTPVSKVIYKQDFNDSLLKPENYSLTCNAFNDVECVKNNEWKFFTLRVLDVSSLLQIQADSKNISSRGSENQGLFFYVKHNALPTTSSYDYLVQFSNHTLLIPFPRIGWWYIGVYSFKGETSYENEDLEDDNFFSCFSLTWKIFACNNGFSGENCSWKIHTLERRKRMGAAFPSESYYLPISFGGTYKQDSFLLDQLLSNSSKSNRNEKWTFFVIDAPPSATGGIISVQMSSINGLNFDLFAKHGSLPTSTMWDYNSTGSVKANSLSNKSLSKDLSDKSLDIIYPREGSWCIGLRQFIDSKNDSGSYQARMSILLQGCPKHCSNHGSCQHSYDESGMILCSYCSCDRTHGGFDCSIELISPTGHNVQSLALIVSNIASILPAFWSIRQKAYAEWIIYTTSGVSSALYHSCDAGKWCALTFHALQFLDFWLSFMAVVATFIYISTIDDRRKMSVLVGATIVTALIAVNGPTRPINVILVITIGVFGLIFGWVTRFCNSNMIANMRSCLLPTFNFRWQAIKQGLYLIFKNLQKRFRWIYLCIGFLTLGMAALSWFMETGQTYWIWHSLWHIFVYTSSFFFLKSPVLQEPAVASVSSLTYQPVSQDSQHNQNIHDNAQQPELDPSKSPEGV